MRKRSASTSLSASTTFVSGTGPDLALSFFFLSHAVHAVAVHNSRRCVCSLAIDKELTGDTLAMMLSECYLSVREVKVSTYNDFSEPYYDDPSAGGSAE